MDRSFLREGKRKQVAAFNIAFVAEFLRRRAPKIMVAGTIALPLVGVFFFRIRSFVGGSVLRKAKMQN